ncbi:tRNA pseudouridine(55) synthase TruB [Anaerosporobacter faecicola]|uniref:tRNA pseudouridine(55) synthase TruB n=1 Tax=Anaerosporobacter faecicola TaxID=2718714 RepID=UPI00143ABE1E|nr:tRNA pseudouridine(55) synthase TruB [Anaerosporobacter faecicola]
MINGIINIYKEKGFTSHDVVAKLRGITKQKKIGHTGTLDPDATGVLPVCLGNATKLCDLLTDKDKEYKTVLQLGTTTDTQDITGQILEQKQVKVTKEQICEVIQSFVGDIMQIPPMYSALKVNGKKLYELAREGKVVERKPRPITIHDITIQDIILEQDCQEVHMTVSCSKGTYIRTLCHDIGEKLGCGGCMKSLIRTKVSQFTVENAITLEQAQKLQEAGSLEEHMVTVADMFPHYPKIIVNELGERFLANGNPLRLEHIQNIEEAKQSALGEDKQVRIYNKENQFHAIYEWGDPTLLKPVKMFLN